MDENPSYSDLEKRIKTLEHQLAEVKTLRQDSTPTPQSKSIDSDFPFSPEILNNVGDPFFIKNEKVKSYLPTMPFVNYLAYLEKRS